MKITSLLLCLAMVCLGQTPMNQTSGPPPTPLWVQKYFNDGTNITYECRAKMSGPATSVQRSDSTLTNIVNSSTTATVTAPSHQLYVGAFVTVSGATVDTDLNGTYQILTAADANTYTFTTASVGNATYTESTLKITTSSPLINAALWSIHVFKYTGSFIDAVYWALNAVEPPRLKCSDRALY